MTITFTNGLDQGSKATLTQPGRRPCRSRRLWQEHLLFAEIVE